MWETENGTVKKVVKSSEGFFPIGFYHLGNGPSVYADLPWMRDVGCNTLFCRIGPDSDNLVTFCRENGIAIIAEPNGMEFPEIVLNYGDVITALIGFDDLDSQKPDKIHTVDEVRSLYELMKTLYPNHLIYSSGGWDPVLNMPHLDKFKGLQDLLALQLYPIPVEETTWPLSIIDSCITKFTEDFDEPIIANLQCFGWDGVQRLPTEAELINMTYRALHADVAGIIFYTYNGETNINDHPDIKRTLGNIVTAIRLL